MNAVTIFTQVKEYWLSTAIKYANQLNNKILSKEQKIDVLKNMLLAARDAPVDGIVFPCNTSMIDGHNQICVKGTILDVSDPKSLIYPYYKTFVTCVKILLVYYEAGDINKIKALWNKYVKKDIELTEQVVIDELLGAVEYCFGKDSYIDKLIEKAKEGEWKLGL